MKKSFRWRTDIQTVQRDGYEWEGWTIWCWTWQWCWPGYENVWYDGPHKTIKFGFATLYWAWDHNYNERRKVA